MIKLCNAYFPILKCKCFLGERGKKMEKSRILEVAKFEDYYKILHTIHCSQCDHAGMIKTWKMVASSYSAISKPVVEKFVKFCEVCCIRITQSPLPWLCSMRSKNFWVLKPKTHFLVNFILLSSTFCFSKDRSQLEIIDMQQYFPNDEYKFIGHIVCHFSRFHVLWPMKTRTGDELQECLRRHVFSYFGVPKVFQADHGSEFKSDAVKNLIRSWPGECQILHARSKYQLSQGNA